MTNNSDSMKYKPTDQSTMCCYQTGVPFHNAISNKYK